MNNENRQLHKGTFEITCPYCGYEDLNSWEKFDGGTMECGHCGKDFEYERNILVSYNSYRKVDDCDHSDSFTKILCEYCGTDIRTLEVIQ